MFLSDNTNIHGFWLEMLRELKRNAIGTQKAKASMILEEGIRNKASGVCFICFNLDIADADFV